MRIRSVTATLLCAVLLGACAHATPRAGGDALAANDEVAPRQTRDEVDRWVTRKQMCRELGVRFDSSGLCW